MNDALAAKEGGLRHATVPFPFHILPRCEVRRGEASRSPPTNPVSRVDTRPIIKTYRDVASGKWQPINQNVTCCNTCNHTLNARTSTRSYDQIPFSLRRQMKKKVTRVIGETPDL